jgi:hypothetical protein
VLTKGRFGQDINQVKIVDHRWRKKHFCSIEQSYRIAPHFAEHRERFRALYLDTDDEFLSDINHRFMTAICEILGIATKISWSTDYRIPTSDRTGRLIEICQQTGADAYLSGPAAREYLDRRSFAIHGIAVEFMDYSDYAEYPQLYPPFEHPVSVLDLIFNQGPNATCFMKSFGRGQVGS